MRLKTPARAPLRAVPVVLFFVSGLFALGVAMWMWAVSHSSHSIDLEQHGIRVLATVVADGSNPKSPSEQLSFPLPDGSTATQWSSTVSSQQTPGSTVAVVYLPGQPSSVESTEYLRWWWIGAAVMPVFGTAFVVAGLWTLRSFARTLRQDRALARQAQPWPTASDPIRDAIVRDAEDA
jgi:hypothetical protein